MGARRFLEGQALLEAYHRGVEMASLSVGVRQVEEGGFPVLVLDGLDQLGKGLEVPRVGVTGVVGGRLVPSQQLGHGGRPFLLGRPEGHEEPGNGLRILPLVQLQHPRLALDQRIGPTGGLVSRPEKVLGQDQVVRPQVFHPDVEQAGVVAGRQPLGGPETRQGLVGLVACRKGGPKGDPRLDAVGIEARRPTKVPLRDVVPLAGVVVRRHGKPGPGLLR
mmetsp:Transcript_96802/g.196684  ORF Transcript_96802/g.196684 Transcript_96802/m.196684 type:complete len:220 (+) Transcript_96802:698-1357(+)